MNTKSLKEQIYNKIMTIASKIVKENLSNLNESSIDYTTDSLISTMYMCLYDMVKFNKLSSEGKISYKDEYKSDISEFEQKLLIKFKDITLNSKTKLMKSYIFELIKLLNKAPEQLDELLSDKSYLYHSIKYFNNNPNLTSFNDYIKQLKSIKYINFDDSEFNKNKERKESNKTSDSLFANDFDSSKNNYGVPKEQSAKKFAFAAMQDFVKNFPDEVKKRCNETARELGYDSWKDAFVNYGINVFTFIRPYRDDKFDSSYVRGENGGDKSAEYNSKQNWQYNKYAYTTRFANQWVFPEDFNPEDYLLNVCGRKRLDNSYIENCKEVARREVMLNMFKNNYQGIADRLKIWKDAFKK